jgi:peptide/nickel transport system permease protein
MVALAVILFYALVALLVAFGLIAADFDQGKGLSYEAPSMKHLLGTDIFGRDVLTRVIYGTKISMSVGLIASLIAIPIGVFLGAIAGFFGKFIDDIIVWFYSTLSSIPGIFLVLAFSLVLKGKTFLGIPMTGLNTVYLAIGLTSWVGICRIIRAEVIKHKEREYVLSAKAFGASSARQIFVHILPNIFHLVIIDFSLRFIGAIQAEVIISFLGLGAVNLPSWGVMISDAKLELSRGVWWQLAGATSAMFFIVLALNIFGDALRDALDPKLKNT